MYLFIYSDEEMIESVCVNNYTNLELANIITELYEKCGSDIQILLSHKFSEDPILEISNKVNKSIYENLHNTSA